MTLVALCSLKGAPGVTTLSCLLGAAWPGPGPVMLVEADPSGGDLAARFGLSSRVGWTSLTQSSRRSDEPGSVDPHLQTLPGGLPVLVAARGDERRSADGAEGRAVRSGPVGTVVRSGPAGPVGTADPSGTARSVPSTGLTLVDLGRIGSVDPVSGSWLDRSDLVLLVVHGDVPTSVRLRDRSESLSVACHGRLGLVVVGGSVPIGDVAGFAGIAPLADVPFDPTAAEVACGGSGSGRRLERSPLWLATVRLAALLESRLSGGWSGKGSTVTASVVPDRTPVDGTDSAHGHRVTTTRRGLLARIAAEGRRSARTEASGERVDA